MMDTKRCMRLHKLVYECLTRRMIKGYTTNEAEIPKLRKFTEKFKDGDDWEKRREILEDVYKRQEFQIMINHAFERIVSSESEYGKF